MAGAGLGDGARAGGRARPPAARSLGLSAVSRSIPETRLAARIQSHPLRLDLAVELRACLDERAEIIYDPAPTDGLRSPWRTYRYCLETAPADATHVLVVQDDVVACPHLLEAVEAAIRARPDRVLCFFVAGNPLAHSRAVLAACERDEAWAELPLTKWVPVVATCWPADRIGPLLAWYDAQSFPAGFTADDAIVGLYLRHTDDPPLASVPSLVQHPDLVPSLTHRRAADGLDPGRLAACWLGDCPELECDARRIDWTTGPG